MGHVPVWVLGPLIQTRKYPCDEYHKPIHNLENKLCFYTFKHSDDIEGCVFNLTMNYHHVKHQ